MNESRWIRVTTRESIPPREGRAIRLADRELAIFNLGDRFLAVENRCPHQGGPLSDGIVTGSAVVCPLHAWKVSLETGEVARPSSGAACVRTFATRVDGDTLLVLLPAGAATDGGAERAA
ncbi:MAG: nitrite reductase small subunit NirD [Vicinamibacterales bacterium]